MTCIIGLAHEGKVYMGGDSMQSDGWNRLVTTTRKVFRMGEFLIGTCGSIRMGQILQYHLVVRAHEEGEDDFHYIVTGFGEAVRAAFRELGYLKIESNREESGSFMVGYRGQIYRFDSDLQVANYVNGVYACGVDTYALGAMLALEHLPPVERIMRSLEITAQLSTVVDAPFYVETLEAKGE